MNRELLDRSILDLPEPPEGASVAGTAAWIGSIAIKAIRERNYDPATARRLLLLLLVRVAATHEPDDAKILSEFRHHLERARAGAVS